MKWEENEILCWVMKWGWVTWKWSLICNNDDNRKTVQKLFTKKKKINK